MSLRWFGLLACFVLSHRAAYSQWVQTAGPPGGIVKAFITYGPKFIVGAGGGVFITTNNGTTWTLGNNGLTYRDVHAFVIDGSKLYAATYGGVFSSTDGEHWNAAGLTDIDIDGLVSVPNGSGGTNLFAAAFESVYRSIDNGTTWIPMSAGLPTSFLRILTATPNGAGGANIFLGTGDGVFRSTNYGASWTLASTGILSNNILALVSSPEGTLYAGTSGGVYRSTNSGTNWMRISNGMSQFTWIYGLTQKPNGSGGSDLFAATYGGGVFRSTDNGANWTWFNTGLVNTAVFALGVNLNGPNGGTIFAGSLSGGFRSIDNGSTWASAGIRNSIVLDLAMSPSGPGRIFAATYDDIFRSTNNGAEWIDASIETNLQFNALAVNPYVPGEPTVFGGTAGSGMYWSSNNGNNWTYLTAPFDDPNILSILVTPDGTGGTYVLAGTFDGLWISTNNGTNWTEINSGLTNTVVLSLAAVPNGTSPPALFAGTYGSGAFRSTNAGANWSEVNSGLTDGLIISLGVRGASIFAGTGGGGVFRSTNSGVSWSAVNTGLSATIVLDIAVAGSNVFVGTDAGVFHSADNGERWSDVSAGLGYVYIRALALSADGMNLLAGTSGGGVWRRPLSEVITSTEDIARSTPGRFTLEQNYPNPFNPTTTIVYETGSQELVELRVYDLLGREVRTLVREMKNAGVYSTTFDGSQLASGVYIYRLRSGSFLEARRLHLMK